MSSEQVIMENLNLNFEINSNSNSNSVVESEAMNANVTQKSNGRRIGFLRRKIIELQDELDTLLALEPVKVSKNVKGRPKSVKKLSPQQEADDDLFANLVDEMWSETTPDVKKFNISTEELVVEEESVAVSVVKKAPVKKEKKHVLTEEEKAAKKAALAEEKKLKKEAEKAAAAEEKKLKKEAEKAAKKSESAKKAAATRAANKLALKAAATANDSDNESTNKEAVAPLANEVVENEVVAPEVAPLVTKAVTKTATKAVTKTATKAVTKTATKAVPEVEVEVEVKPTKVTVSRITIGDIKYLKSNTNVLYNPDTKEEVGMYDAETNSVKPLPDNEDDEISEDEYESDDE
jgi:hypothetical protein